VIVIRIYPGMSFNECIKATAINYVSQQLFTNLFAKKGDSLLTLKLYFSVIIIKTFVTGMKKDRTKKNTENIEARDRTICCVNNALNLIAK